MLSFLVFSSLTPRPFRGSRSSPSSLPEPSAHAKQSSPPLPSHPNPAPTRHTRHAAPPATPSCSYASAQFPSHRGCAPRASTKNPLLFPYALPTPLDTIPTNPPATIASKRLPGTLNPVDATLTKIQGWAQLLLTRHATIEDPERVGTEGSVPVGKRVYPHEHRVVPLFYQSRLRQAVRMYPSNSNSRCCLTKPHASFNVKCLSDTQKEQ